MMLLRYDEDQIKSREREATLVTSILKYVPMYAGKCD